MVGFHRYVFLIDVDTDTGDQFFGGPAGYRGAFAMGTQQGESANRRLISRLRELLLRASTVESRDAVEAALDHPSAKVWISQKGGQFHHSLTPTEPEVLVTRWLENYEAAKAHGIERIKALPRKDRPAVHKAIWGVRLHGPITKLEIMSAWIDKEDRIGAIPADKTHRSLDIHRYGYT
jgi:hypothetical protein